MDQLINYHNLLRMSRASGWPNAQMYQPTFSNMQYAMGGAPGTPWNGQGGASPHVSPMLPQRKPKRRGRKRAIRQSRGIAGAAPMMGGGTTMPRPGFGFRPTPYTRPQWRGEVPTANFGRPWINEQYADIMR